MLQNLVIEFHSRKMIALAVPIPYNLDLIFICGMYGRLGRYNFHLAPRFSGIKRIGFALVLYGLFAVSQFVIGNAAMVIGDGQLGVQLNGLGAVFNFLLIVAQLPVGDAAII